MNLTKNNGKLTLYMLIIVSALVITSQTIVTTSIAQIINEFSISSATAQ